MSKAFVYKITRTSTVWFILPVDATAKYHLTFAAFLNNKHGGYCYVKIDTMSADNKRANRLHAEPKLGEHKNITVLPRFLPGNCPPVSML